MSLLLLFVGARTATTPPIVGGSGLGKRYVDLSKRERGFSRKYFEEYMAAQAAQRELERKAAETKQTEEKQALEEAALATQQALAQIEVAEAEVRADLVRLKSAIQATVAAENIRKVIERANLTVRAAELTMQAIDEEEETIALLLLH